VGHWGTGDVQVRADDMEQVEYVLGLIEQAYRLTL
jgi:predicted transport protein